MAQNEQTLNTSETDASEFVNTDNKTAFEDLNSILQGQDLSPIKFHAQPQHQKVKQAKQKLTKAAQNLQTSFNSVVINISPIKVVSCSSNTSDPINSKESDLNTLMNELKSKFDSFTYQEKIQILTLKPASWPTEKMSNFFNTSKHSVQKAINLKKKVGSLSMPIKAKRKRISDEELQKVANFLNDNEYLRLLPGKKDYVSVRINGKKHLYIQTRLLLGNLSELYQAFKSQHPTIKISFAKFCSVRPKWCRIIGSPGSHNVCVCQKHQNSILAALALDLDYKKLMKLLVCDVKNRICTIYRCESCSGKEAF